MNRNKLKILGVSLLSLIMILSPVTFAFAGENTSVDDVDLEAPLTSLYGEGREITYEELDEEYRKLIEEKTNEILDNMAKDEAEKAKANYLKNNKDTGKTEEELEAEDVAEYNRIYKKVINGIAYKWDAEAKAKKENDEEEFMNAYIDEHGYKIIQPDEVIKNTYWADLERVDQVGGFATGVFPKYVLKPGETINKEVVFNSSLFGIDDYYYIAIIQGTPNHGISSNPVSAKTDEFFVRYGSKVIEDDTGQNGNVYPDYKNYGLDIGSNLLNTPQINKFNFKESHLLDESQLANPENIQAYADLFIMKDGKNVSTKEIGQIKENDNFDLHFNLNADWMNKYVNGSLMAKMRVGFMGEEKRELILDSALGCYQTQIAFTLSIPNGVDIPDEISPDLYNRKDGVLKKIDNDVKLDSKKVVNENDGSKLVKLVYTIEFNEEEKWNAIGANGLLDKVNSIDYSNLEVVIPQLHLTDDSNPDTIYQLRGTASGFNDWYIKTDEDDYKRFYNYFVAKQAAEGIDDAIKGKNLDNMITYSFKKEPEPTPTPEDPEQPTPENPEQPTPVNPEQPTPVNPEQPTPEKPQQPQQPNKPVKGVPTGDGTNVALYGLLAAAGLLGTFVTVRKKKSL